MNREEIEAKDRRLTKKIRDIVDRNEKRKSIRKPFWQASQFWLPVLFTGLAVLALLIFRPPSTTIQPVKTGEAFTDAIASKAPPVSTAVSEPREPTDAQEPASAAETPGEAHLPASDETTLAGTQPLSRDAEQPAESPPPPDPSMEPSETAEAAPAGHTTISPAIIQISEMVSCSSVSHRQCISPKSIYSIKEKSAAIVWMRVLSDNPPFTLTHVYYLNGNRYCAVPLKISYPHMRTWSQVTLNHMDQTGNWRVEAIAEDGRTLSQIEFAVVP